MSTSSSRIETDSMYVDGTLRAKAIVLSTGCVTDASVSASADISASKVEQQYSITYRQDDGADVVGAIAPIHIVYGATASLMAVKVACVDAPSGGGDKAFTVDVRRANQGTPSPATVLTGVVTINNGRADCEVVSGTVASASLVSGDMLLVVVSASGTTGVQGQGLIVTLIVREDAN